MKQPKKLIPSNKNLILMVVATLYGIGATINVAHIAWQKPAGPTRNLFVVMAVVLSFVTLSALLTLLRIINMRWWKK
jgi:hypothetical protein